MGTESTTVATDLPKAIGASLMVPWSTLVSA